MCNMQTNSRGSSANRRLRNRRLSVKIALAAGAAVLLLSAPALAGEAPAAAGVGPGGLARAYTDGGYLLWWDAYSHHIQPWRAWLETVPAARALAGVGIGGPGEGQEAEQIARMLKKNGFACSRYEVGWGHYQVGDNGVWKPNERARKPIAMLGRIGLRPLLLVNGHHGYPCPYVQFQRTVTADAPAGAREVRFDSTDGFVPWKTGFFSLADYIASFPLFIEIKENTVKLSKPLPKEIKAGTRVNLSTLRCRPFGAAASPEYAETLQCWKDFVLATATDAVDALGTRGKEDVGFDVEVWNELTFGSAFLSITNYCDQLPADFKGGDVWNDLVAATAEVAEKHPDLFRGATIVNGISNTIPWPAAETMPPRVGGLSKHPYYGRVKFPESAAKDRHYAGLDFQPIAAQPQYEAFFPEYSGSLLRTDHILWDSSPWARGYWSPPAHGRFARGPGRPPVNLWMTEIGVTPIEGGIAEKKDDPDGTQRKRALAFKAKVSLRTLVFWLNKGTEKVFLFCSHGGDFSFGLVQDDFVAWAKANPTADYPKDDAAFTSPSLKAVRSFTETLRDGLDEAISAPRQLTVTGLNDRHGRVQFPASSGCPALPDREVVAVLPFQVNAHRFVVAAYVVTRDVTKDYAPAEFAIGLGNLRGEGATVRVVDPLDPKAAVPAAIKPVEGGAEVTVALSDAPRLLVIDEAKAGPVVQNPELRPLPAGGAQLRFTSPAAAEATVTWGQVPLRETGLPGEYFDGHDLAGAPVAKGAIGRRLEAGWGGSPANGVQPDHWSARWKARLQVPADGTYTFFTTCDDGARLIVDGRKAVEDWRSHGPEEHSGTLDLRKGIVPLVMEFFDDGATASLKVEWEGPGVGRRVLALGGDLLLPEGRQRVCEWKGAVKAGETAIVPIPDLKPGEGVRVNLAADGCTAVWPVWDSEPSGMIPQR